MRSLDFYWPSLQFSKVLYLDPYASVPTRFSESTKQLKNHFSHLGDANELVRSYITNEYSDIDMSIHNAKCIHCFHS